MASDPTVVFERSAQDPRNVSIQRIVEVHRSIERTICPLEQNPDQIVFGLALKSQEYHKTWWNWRLELRVSENRHFPQAENWGIQNQPCFGILRQAASITNVVSKGYTIDVIGSIGKKRSLARDFPACVLRARFQ
ncbi:predicted protein [Sclerotinia sclerotiorum 1980 UF-70]|uniref:Uncharacterized protein n=1 Tax=Sclerotinia sclerotiorum (strain ATCC 18683 / 1980 / Ss-1) TaxID=665079 RepID=A7E5S9_SCLS1|nr:predicted protein [Sclerotinia sclerotiorum 1980 UF-70]EDN91251.1 predicted protein [Sclerotinia sclerotiorum 1980 UF-70]